MNEKYCPCNNCPMHEEIVDEDYPSFGNECDGCFYFEYGCTEDEFYIDDCGTAQCVFIIVKKI